MTMDATVVVYLIAFAVFIGIVIGYNLSSTIHILEMRKQAIDRGFAQYDSKTGKWKWKEPAP